MRDYRLQVDLRIARPRREVIAWWTGFPDDYRAEDPREQPHRIRVLRRDDGVIETLTYWRAPLGRELVIPETLHLYGDDGFGLDAVLPLGLRQHDEFTFRERDGVTIVTIAIELHAPTPLARIARPAFWRFYARPMYPRTFAAAARLCDRDAPRLGAPRG